MIAPWPCSPTFPAHHADAYTTSVVGQVWSLGCVTNAPALSGRQAPPTGAPGPLRRASRLVRAVALGFFRTAPYPLPWQVAPPHYSLPPASVDSLQRWSWGLRLRLRRAGKCVSAALRSLTLFSGRFSLEAVCSGRGPTGVEKGLVCVFRRWQPLSLFP